MWIMAVDDFVDPEYGHAFDGYDLSIMPVSHCWSRPEVKSDYQTEGDTAEHAKPWFSCHSITAALSPLPAGGWRRRRPLRTIPRPPAILKTSSNQTGRKPTFLLHFENG